VVLTARGERAVKEIVETEGSLRRRLEMPTSTRRVREAAAVLRGVRKALEDQMPRLLRSR
jgi:hypothetical protein